MWRASIRLGSPLGAAARAEELLETTDQSVDRIAEEVGFGTAAMLRHHFTKARSVSPQQYRRTFSPLERRRAG